MNNTLLSIGRCLGALNLKHISKANFHTSPNNLIFCTSSLNRPKKRKIPRVYPKNFKHPNPDVTTYYKNKPVKGDEVYSQQFLPASNDYYYSIFFDFHIHKLKRRFIRRGNAHIAKRIIDEALENIKVVQVKKYHQATTDEERRKIELNPITIANQAIENCKPVLAVKSVARGGTSYRVPIPIKEQDRLAMATRWMYKNVSPLHQKTRKSSRLAKELLEAYDHKGNTVAKKLQLHKEAEANRAYVSVAF